MAEERLLRVGCSGLPAGVPRERYFARLDLLEVEDTFFEPPRLAALQRWRREAPPAAGFAALAWQIVTHPPGPRGYPRLKHAISASELAALGSLRDTGAVRAALARTFEAVSALGAEALLFRTPPSFSPSAGNRDTMRRFFGALAPPAPAPALVWEPQGLWDPAAARALADELDIVLACDPLAVDPLAPDRAPPLPEAGGRVYFRVSGLGRRRARLDDDELATLAEMVQPFARAWVVFAHAEKYRDAVRFADLSRT